ncbi:MAG TPA: PEP-utilizing enzyme, partial [Chloroflexota bacterium]|nr:PEP-utilizing enzyme [Chloroflexota bacterium]
QRIETLYGRPMDVEWAVARGTIFILQARPITALPEPVTIPTEAREAEWHLPKPKGRYARGSVLELLPDPLTPLFATLGLPAWNQAMNNLIGSTLGDIGLNEDGLITINGYGYYDITFGPAATTKLLLALPRILAAYPGLMGSARARWQEELPRYIAVVDHWRDTNLATVSAEQLLGGVRDIVQEAADYYLTIQSGILPAAYISESLFTLVYNRLFKRHGDPSALTFLLGYDSAPMRAEKTLYDLAAWVREQPGLAAALQSMTSEQFANAYWAQRSEPGAAEGAWPEFWRRLDGYLALFGHTIYDLDFAKPVLADDPGPLLEALKFFIGGQAPNPYERQARAAEARERATQSFLSRLIGLRLRIFRRLIRSAQEFAPLREDALADVGLGWPVLRRMLREAGRRLVAADAIANPDDVYWLTRDELRADAAALDAGRPPAAAQALVAKRRATWEKERAVTPPVALPVKGGARFLGIDFSGVMPARSEQAEGNVLKGIAASPGQVTGLARVIHGPEEFDQMRPGDILVARITTPAWTPLFALAAGVVTDVGGPLSHSSIVAREYHIPAVLGTGVATERLASGQRLAVDGTAGTVTIVDGVSGGTSGEVVRRSG